MPEIIDPLPLRALAVFEAAGRLGSFTEAAAALAMTQTAVSQHVARLEADIGAALFERRHRGVALTAIGAALHEATERGLATLTEGVAAARRKGARGTIQILTDFGFAYGWLMPRMAELNALLPGIEICVATTSVDLGASDADCDLAIAFGDGAWPRHHVTPLFAEVVYPVAGGALAGAQGGMTAQAIAALPLVHLRGPSAQRALGWDDWFRFQGIERPSTESDIFVDHYQIALQMAQAGRGACLGWAPLVEGALADGRLLRLSEHEIASTRGYHLAEPIDAHPGPAVAALKAWLLAAGRLGNPFSAGDTDDRQRVPEPA